MILTEASLLPNQLITTIIDYKNIVEKKIYSRNYLRRLYGIIPGTAVGK